MPDLTSPDHIIHHGDCLDVMRAMPDSSVDSVIADPPYYRVKNDAWDRQWANPVEFLKWLGVIADEWARLLKPNGSLYCFASPRMAARVEVMLGERFNVLNNVRWVKESGWHRKAQKECLRSYLSPWEACIFAEHYGADNIAKGEAGYIAKCDELRGFVFEPLRKYFDDERKRCGISNDQIMDGMGSRGVGRYMFARHTFSRSQWQLPTREQYEAARDLFDTFGKSGEYLRREYEYLRREYEELRREYEELRREYEELRRPFSVSSESSFTDIWSFPTVQAYRGKHPCEKPVSLLRHIIGASTRPGAVVLDPFAGSGSTGVAALAEGRRFIGIERESTYVEIARARIRAASE